MSLKAVLILYEYNSDIGLEQPYCDAELNMSMEYLRNLRKWRNI